ncbi:benzoate 4-monooxygenase cytochrome-like protein P450 [Tricladium varicosporioides]|nr:benzoate 4-monooxygenase cytochrome-like protein P450 [Hymenoscyphus varicosporioides]
MQRWKAFYGGFCQFFASAIYNLYFSPLSKFPGPFFAKISRLPSFYHSLTGYRHVWIRKCHQKYGEVFRFAPNGVLFNSESAFRTIHGHKSNVRKSDFYVTWRRNSRALNSGNTVDPAHHARKRRVVNTALSDLSVRSAEPFIIKHVDRLCEVLTLENQDGNWSEPKNATQFADCLFLDLMGDLCFGKSFEIKEPAENPLKDIPEQMSGYMTFLYVLGQLPGLGIFCWLKPRGLDALMEYCAPPAVRRMFKFIDENLAERIELEKRISKVESGSNEARKDIFHYVSHAKDPQTGTPYSKDELFAECGLYIVAGSGTSAVVLSAFFFYVTRNAEVQRKLLQEICRTFASVDEIRGGAKLFSCKYLRACIDEIIRISPPGSSELPRVVLPGGIEVDGNFFPEGTNIGVTPSSLSLKESTYGDPLRFRPERWIVDEQNGVTAADVSRIQSAFMPFSLGPTNCAGQKLAITELMIMIARIMYQLEVRAVPGDTLGEAGPGMGFEGVRKDFYEFRDAYMTQRDGPMVQFRRRDMP